MKKAHTDELIIPTGEHEKAPLESSASPEGSKSPDVAPVEDQKQPGQKGEDTPHHG